MSKMQDYMSEIGENIKSEGEALEKYQSLKSRILSDLHYCEQRMERQKEYDNKKNPPMDEEGNRLDMPEMDEDDMKEYKKFMEDAEELIELIDEIIADEMNHTVRLMGKMACMGHVNPSKDGLEESMKEITTVEKEDEEEEDDDDTESD